MLNVKRLNDKSKKTPRVLNTLSQLQKDKIIRYHQYFNNKMKILKKKVLLLIDNAGGHNCTIEFLDSLTNVKVHFLPPNCTSVIRSRHNSCI